MVHSFCRYRLPEVSINFTLETVSLQLAGNNYFHRTSRCHSCLTIEANIDDALKAHFADELDDGSLLWLPTNIDEPENAHFEEDFSLEFSSAVIFRLDGKKVVSWTNLKKVWDIFENKEEFLVYIQQAVGSALARDSKEQDTQKQR